MLTVEERLARYRDVLDGVTVNAFSGNAFSGDASSGDASSGDASSGHGTSSSTADVRRPRRTRMVAVGVLVSVSIVAIVVAARVREGAPQSPATSTEPIGSWHEGAAPPFELQSPMQSATTDDGRIVVLGGLPHNVDHAAPYAGGIYDPSADAWQVAPAAPFTGGGMFRLAGNTLVATTDADTGPAQVALLDLTTMQWTSIDVPAPLDTSFRPWTWDGQTLAVVNTGRSGPSGDTAEPFTMRWSLCDRAWHEVLGPRSHPVQCPRSG